MKLTAALTCSLILSMMTTGCLEDTLPLPDANNLTSPGFRGESCTQETGCTTGLACQGGFCQATCSEVSTCEMYPDTFCIAPVPTRMAERFCLRPGEFDCEQALDSDAFCAQVSPAQPRCVEKKCVEESTSVPNNNTPMPMCESDASCAMAGDYCDVSDMTCKPGCREEGCGDEARCVVATRQCEETCADDTSCAAGSEACLPTTDDPARSFCEAITSCAQSEQPNAWCQRSEGTLRTRCDADICVPITRAKLAIQIVDLSTGISCQEPRGNLSDSGSDIISVELFDEGGELLSFGKSEVYEVGSGSNDFISTAHLDGQMPDIDNSGCPVPDMGQSFRSDSVTSLGCNGYMIVSFPDMELERTLLLPGFTVAVSEYDEAVCPDTSGLSRGDDLYEVYLCEDLNDDGEIANSECDVLISDEPAGGYTFHSVPE